MPISDQTRISRDQQTPRIVALWHALARLQTVVSFMNTGAHPDDETSAMLAAIGLRDGIDISYACSTRGEGGQNDIGTEAGQALGVLRTAEMERACDVLNLRMYWLSETPDDTIFDFGFSKSGVETMSNWGHDRTIARFVDILRMERPDIICPTFLDIPGQHGHHRAMTLAAHLVMDLCADPDYRGSDYLPWQVKKLYLPAWSGAGQAYDDDVPPPPATLTVNADGRDPVTGFSYEQIGQQSRAFHKTQAMGRWISTGTERNWPLHLADSRTDAPDTDLSSGLPSDLRDLGIPKAQDSIDAARAAFPDFSAVLHHASAALGALDISKVDPDYGHKIRRKRAQISDVIRLASGAQVHARLDRDQLVPTDATKAHIEIYAGNAEKAVTAYDLPKGWKADDDEIHLDGADTTDPYPSVYLPGQPDAPCVTLQLKTHGVTSSTRHAFEAPPQVLPDHVVDLRSNADVINRAAPRRSVDLAVSVAEEAVLALEIPEGWTAEQAEVGFTITLPDDVPSGRYLVETTLDNVRAQTVNHIAHDHIDARALARPAAVAIQVIDVSLPDVRVGYIGGGNDAVAHWVRQMGMDVTELSDDDLQSDAVLAGYDSIIIGIFAMKFRNGLAAQMPRIHRWTKSGGTLLTLYHRPWDNWEPSTIPPAFLEIGQPSLRWRVTDQTAVVTHLSDHPILSFPNQITAADWDGWHKERGLYFAKNWDAAYAPLVEMADPDEALHQGALLAADIGAGRHVHCALILHLQMEALVPGAFALMANILAKRA